MARTLDGWRDNAAGIVSPNRERVHGRLQTFAKLHAADMHGAIDGESSEISFKRFCIGLRCA